MNLIQDTVKNLLLSLGDGCTELWVIPKDLIRRAPDLRSSEVCSLTKIVVGQLIEKYNVKKIDMISRQITDISLDEANEEIDRIFAMSRGGLPTIGDGFWMTKL